MAMYLLILSILACENQIVQLVPARRSRLQSSLAQDQAFDPEPAKERSDQHSSVCMNLTFKLVHTKKIKMTMTNYEKKTLIKTGNVFVGFPHSAGSGSLRKH